MLAARNGSESIGASVDSGRWGMKRIATVIGLSGLISIGMFGAAGAESDHRHVSAISKKIAAKEYVSIVAPVNVAADRFNSQANEWSDSTTNAQAETDATPLIAAVLKLNSKLANGSWPASSGRAIKSLIKIDATLIGDLRSLSAVDNVDSSSVFATFRRDQGDLGAAATAVRHDLGLPAVKS